MTIRQLITIIIFLSLFVMAARISMDTDSWWHLRAGEWIFENRSILQSDPFSYTRLGADWKYPGWLYQVPMFLIFDWSGPGGLNLLTAGMVTLAFIFLWYTLWGGVFLRASVMILAAAVSGVYWSARPHLVTFLLTAIFLYILESERWKMDLQSRKRLWLLPVIMIFWVNSHGGFAVGFILCAIYAISRLAGWLWRGELFSRLQGILKNPGQLKMPDYWLFWVCLVLLLSACFNPSGVVILTYPFKTVTISSLQEYIQEWQSPNFHQLSVQPFIWMILALIAAAGISRRRMALTDFLLISVFGYMGFLAGRNLALFALVTAPALTRHFEALSIFVGQKMNLRTEEVSSKKLQTLNVLILFLLVAAGMFKVASIIPYQVNQAAFRDYLPVEAAAFIKKELPEGNMFNSYNWGGYLIWELRDAPVFVDGRTDLYNDDIISQWMQAYQAQDGWEEIFQRWQIGWVLIEREAPLVWALDQAGWQQLYSDDLAVIYRR